MSINKFKLAICTRFNAELHGIDENSTPGIENHYLVLYTIELEEFYNNDYINILKIVHENTSYDSTAQQHIKLDIIKCDELIGLEQVGYINTFWLKIVQRRWKKIYKMRQQLLKACSSPRALLERQRTGQWPKQLRECTILN
jgi:hypothetical protein